MKLTKETLSEAEWEVLRVLWAKQPCSSREIITILQATQAWSPSTVKTLLQRLYEKQYIQIQKVGRQNIYTSCTNQVKIGYQKVWTDFSKICDTKKGQVLLQLVQTLSLSQEDIRQLQQLLIKKEQTAPKILTCHCFQGQCSCKEEKNEN